MNYQDIASEIPRLSTEERLALLLLISETFRTEMRGKETLPDILDMQGFLNPDELGFSKSSDLLSYIYRSRKP